MALPKKVLTEVLAGIARIVAENDAETLQRVYLILMQKSPASKGPTKAKTAAPSSSKQLFDGDVELREQLYAFESREALANFIDEKFPRKSDVIAASRLARVAVNKSDDYDALVEKLIDATIGYKLRSRAIRGDG